MALPRPTAWLVGVDCIVKTVFLGISWESQNWGGWALKSVLPRLPPRVFWMLSGFGKVYKVWSNAGVNWSWVVVVRAITVIENLQGCELPWCGELGCYDATGLQLNYLGLVLVLSIAVHYPPVCLSLVALAPRQVPSVVSTHTTSFHYLPKLKTSSEDTQSLWQRFHSLAVTTLTWCFHWVFFN